jgi:predicted nucleotidyltransferase
MNRAEIEQCLREVGGELHAKSLVGEIVIVGGAWMTLVLESREATRDVDAYLAPEHAAAIREATRIVAKRHDLPDDWLNDAVKGFFATTPDVVDWAEYPGLRVQAVTADYMLAMKALAGRPQDVDDLRVLTRHLGLTGPGPALAIVERHIPARLLTARTRLLIESLYEEEAG